MDLTGKHIKDYEQVFQCSYAERAETITWTKWPVSRASLAFRRLMGTVQGHTAFAVFVGLVRLCARSKTGGSLTVKGVPLTVADIHGETGIPARMIPPALFLLNSEPIGWIIPCASGALPAHAESAQKAQTAHIERASHAPAFGSVSASVSSSLLPEEGMQGEKPKRPPDRAERIYQAYPRKTAKRAAITAIQTAGKRLASERFDGNPDAACEFLLARTQAYAASRLVQTTPVQFIKHPASWFNAGCYDDDPREWDRARTGSDADQVPVGGSTVDFILGQMATGADDGKARGGRDGEVPRGDVPALESDGGVVARVGQHVHRVSG